jgi:hypothetical protein
MCSQESRPSSVPSASGNISHGVLRSSWTSPSAIWRSSTCPSISGGMPCAISGFIGRPAASVRTGPPPGRARTVVFSPFSLSHVIFQNPAPHVSLYQSAWCSLRRACSSRQ